MPSWKCNYLYNKYIFTENGMTCQIIDLAALWWDLWPIEKQAEINHRHLHHITHEQIPITDAVYHAVDENSKREISECSFSYVDPPEWSKHFYSSRFFLTTINSCQVPSNVEIINALCGKKRSKSRTCDISLVYNQAFLKLLYAIIEPSDWLRVRQQKQHNSSQLMMFVSTAT